MSLADVQTQDPDWDAYWERFHVSAAYNPAQAFRRRELISIMRKYGGMDRSPLRIVDIGSGTGDFACVLNHQFPKIEVLGLEFSREGIELARKRAPDSRFLQADLLQTQTPPPPFEGWAQVATCSEVLEHVDEPARLLANSGAYLARGAKVFITVPSGPISAFDRHIGHRQHFSEAGLGKVIEAAGFRVDDIRRTGFPFFNLYRCAVILRGKKLTRDIEGGVQDMSFAARLAMRTFGILLHFNIPRTPWGWQLVAHATLVDK